MQRENRNGRSGEGIGTDGERQMDGKRKRMWVQGREV